MQKKTGPNKKTTFFVLAVLFFLFLKPYFWGEMKIYLLIKMQYKVKIVGLEAPILLTRTPFFGVNPKDSNRTRLVLDTPRLVLDSYSKKLDSIHH